MKWFLLLVLTFLFFSCIGKHEPTENELHYVNLEHRILTHQTDNSSKWIPTENDVRKTKIAIAKYFDGKALKNNVFINDFKSSINNYCFQFVGIEKRGDKIILCNIIPKDISPEWDSKIIKSEDSGKMRIEVEYDWDDESCYGFKIINPK